MKQKYGNKKVVAEDGTVFDSRKEYQYYLLLQERLKLGEIKDLELQKVFEIIPKQAKTELNSAERNCRYIADFYYFDMKLDCYCIVDTKGFKTKDYIIKRKLCKLLFSSIKFIEVMN